mmetsp:Transcript_39471/g.48854  ORF Transcript_39471/g.48854 Transcript_39471/m.48854 type:complete len:265 (-) Transcript_39471:46-840(-)
MSAQVDILSDLIDMFHENRNNNDANIMNTINISDNSDSIDDMKINLNGNIIEFQEDCLLLRNVINIDDQYSLFKAAMKAASYKKQPKGKMNKNKNFINIMKIIPTHDYHNCRLSPIFDNIFTDTYNKILNLHKTNKIKTKPPLYKNIIKHRMKAYQYTYPKGNMYRHYDNRPGYVMLYSIGCTVIFHVKGPKMGNNYKDNGIQFEMRSGDILFFSASAKSRIEHGVDKVINNTCPNDLINKDISCNKLKNIRVSIQTRFKANKS